jgi:hypothetical protein
VAPGEGRLEAVVDAADADAGECGARLRPHDAVHGQPGSRLERADGRERLRTEDPVGRNTEGALNNYHRAASIVHPKQALVCSDTEKVEREAGLRADDAVHEQPHPLLERPNRLEGIRTKDSVGVDAEQPLHVDDRTATIAELEHSRPHALPRRGPLRTGVRRTNRGSDAGDRRRHEQGPGLSRGRNPGRLPCDPPLGLGPALRELPKTARRQVASRVDRHVMPRRRLGPLLRHREEHVGVGIGDLAADTSRTADSFGPLPSGSLRSF